MKYMWKAVYSAVLLCCIFELGCGDTYRQIATPIVQPAGNPSASGTIGVIQDSETALHGFTQQIDVSGDTNLGEKPIGTGAKVGLLDPSGASMFTADTTSNDVTAISVATFNQVTIGLFEPTASGAGPTYIAGTKIGTVYVAVAGATKACTSGAGYVGVIDSNALTLKSAICLELGADKMVSPTFLLQSPNTLNVYVLDPTTNQMAIIDASANTLQKIVSVGSAPAYAAMSLDQKFVYILNKNSSDISVFDVSAQNVVRTIPAGGSGSAFMVTDARLNRLYVTNTGSGTISAFDISAPATPTAIGAPRAVGPSPVALTPLADGSRVYVANGGDGTVTELLASNLSTLKTFTVNSATSATTTSITSSKDSTKVYAATKDPTNTTNGVTVIRTSDDSMVTTVPSPKLDSTCETACPLFSPVYVFTTR